MCSRENKLSNKTNLSYSNPVSCKIQIFKVTLKISYFSQNFENLQRFFTGETWPWWPWTWCPQGVFGGKLSFRKISAGVASVLFKKSPHFSVPTLKVRPPGGTPRKLPVVFVG
jgi:hypothetical protein